MNPRRRVLLAVSISWLCWIGMARFLFGSEVLPSYARLEREDTEAHVVRARDAVDARAQALGALVGDWAGWDDTYAYAGGELPTFADENVTRESFEDLRIDVVVVAGPSGEILHARGYDADAGAVEALPPAVLASLQAWPPLLQQDGDVGRRVAGLLDTPLGPMLVAARPILTTARTGPPRGMLVFGRRLDGPAVQGLADTAHMRVRLVGVDDPQLPEDLRRAMGDLSSTDAVAVAAIDGDTVAGYARLRDVRGRPAFLLRIEQPRTVWALGVRTTRTLFAALALASVVVAIALYLLGVRLVRTLVHHREVEDLYVDFVEQSSDGVLLLDEAHRPIQANAALRQLVGLHPDDPLDAMPLAALIPLRPEEIDRALGQVSGRVRAPLGRATLLRPDGRQVHLDLGGSRIAFGRRTVLCVVAHDVTDQVEDEERARYFSYHDALTGLPNRQLFQDRLAVALHQAERSGQVVGVMFVDLDHFKAVNDSLGHDHGDRLLVDVAARLAACLRAGDSVARQGGDEFLVLLPQLTSPTDVSVLCERVLDVLRQPFRVDGREVFLTASLGVALSPADGKSAATLLKNADLARYQSKEAGRNGWQLYDRALHERVTELVGMHTRLQHALERDEFILHYQPQVDLRNGRVLGMEALIRWSSPDEGLVPPGRFIPVAEETGLISPIGEWVLRRACAQGRAWIDAGLPPVRIAVNLSARQFVNRDLVGFVRETLEETGLPGALLELEITESLAMRNADAARLVLGRLKELGVSIALDDFGTGYSSLAYVRQFPFDRLKIDRGFLLQAEERKGEAVVAAIIALAHAVELEVVAEGVETQAQYGLLVAHRCDMAQGFGFARPLPADEATALLAARRPLLDRFALRAASGPAAIA